MKTLTENKFQLTGVMTMLYLLQMIPVAATAGVIIHHWQRLVSATTLSISNSTNRSCYLFAEEPKSFQPVDECRQYWLSAEVIWFLDIKSF